MNQNNFNLHLSRRTVFPWTHDNGIHVCGYAFVDGNRLEGRSLADQVRRYAEQSQWETLLQKLNGFFAIIYQTENRVFAATDRVRSIPLFYSQKNGHLYLSDRAEWIRTELKMEEISHISAVEYLVTGFVTGRETLFPGLYQLRAGEYLRANTGQKNITLENTRYFEFLRETINNDTIDQKIEQLHATHLAVFERLVESLDGRRAIIPLSGGYDSRLIAVMLEEVGYDNIQYISYGKPGNWESRISKEIAEYFDRPWTFIPESREKWYDWFNSEERQNYSAYTDHLSSYAHIQDFPFIWYLKKHQKIPTDGIFIPGHSGGLMSGSHVPNHFMQESTISSAELLAHILSKNYSGWNWQKSTTDYKPYFESKIEKQITVDDQMPSQIAADLYENWIWQERQGKYIVPSVMVYEFWDYDWRIPLWDRGMMEFWLHISAAERKSRALYKQYLDKKIKIPVTEANSPKFAKAWQYYNTLANPQYGRFGGDRNLLKAALLQVKDIVNFKHLPFDFVNPRRPIYLQRMTALCSIKYLDEIRERTCSAIANQLK